MNENDLNTIQQLEKALKRNLVKLDAIYWNSRGYVINKYGQVVGLGLFKCRISHLNRFILLFENLKNLSILYLNSNKISDISSIQYLHHLSVLCLNNNKIGDISTLENLNNLISLHLSGNKISDLSPLKNLSHLMGLFLCQNQIKDISPLKDLMNLTILDLSENKINDLSSLENLCHLTELYLGNNKISELLPLKNLNNLSKLDLSENFIETLPLWITHFDAKIQWEKYGYYDYISFYNNPLKIPPVEIVKQGKMAIQNYLKEENSH